MPEPLTASAAALSVGSFLWSTFGQGVTGNEAHRFYLLTLDRWKNAPIDSKTGLPKNHDLLMASRDALREATLVLILELAGRLDPKKPWIPAILDHVRQGKLFKIPLIEAPIDPRRQWLEAFRKAVQSDAFVEEVHDRLILTEDDVRVCFAQGCDASFNRRLADNLSMWAETEVTIGPLPDMFKNVFADGWKINGRQSQITVGQTYCLFFREHLKRRPEVFNIYVADLLGDVIKQLNNSPPLSAPDLSAFERWLEPQLARAVDLLVGLDKQSQSLAIGQTEMLASQGEILVAITTLAIEVQRGNGAAKSAMDQVLAAVLSTQAGVERLMEDAAFKNKTLAEIKTMVEAVLGNVPPRNLPTNRRADISRIDRYAPVELVGRDDERGFLNKTSGKDS